LASGPKASAPERLEQDMPSITMESLVYLLIACFMGFVIGQWIKTRGHKTETKDESAAGLKRRILADTRAQTKKARKKSGRSAGKKGAS
jgi:hypothetical protein